VLTSAASSSEPEPESLSLFSALRLELFSALAGAAAPFLATLVCTSLALESLSEEDMAAGGSWVEVKFEEVSKSEAAALGGRRRRCEGKSLGRQASAPHALPTPTKDLERKTRQTTSTQK